MLCREKNHLSLYMTDSFISLRVDIQLKGQKGRKEIDNLHFLLFPFFLFVFVFQYSNFCIVLQREGKKLVGH